MEWNEIYDSSMKPHINQIKDYIDSSIFEELCKFIETTYLIEPIIQYSSCSLMPGWNIKYRKGNKSICTIYPKEGFCYCMVTIGGKNQSEVEYILPTLDKTIQKIYNEITPLNGSRWLTIEIKNNKVLEDVETLITIKMKTK